MGKLYITIHSKKHCGQDCIWANDRVYISPDANVIECYSDYTAVAINIHGHPVAVWKFDIHGVDSVDLISCGTWVSSKYRKYGIAKKLWNFGIRHFKPKRISVVTASDRGYSLVCSMQEQFPKIEWDVAQNGRRRLK